MGKLLQLKKSPANRAAIIDEFGDVEKLRREFAPTAKRYDQLREEISSWHSDADPEKEIIEKGERYQLALSPRELQRTVDVKAAHKKLGTAKFISICSVTMKALGQLLPKPDVEALLISNRTGSRTFSPTPLVRPPDHLVDLTEKVAA